MAPRSRYIYNTGEHRITGTSQAQQHATTRLGFTSQLGEVLVDQLERIDDSAEPDTQSRDTNAPVTQSRSVVHDDIFETIERLAALKDKGILTEEEFAAKKSELLGRI